MWPPSEETKKAINRTYQRKWRESNPDKVKIYHKKYANNNKQKVAAASKTWRIANPEKSKETAGRFIKNHPEKWLKYRREYYAANPERDTIRTRKAKYGITGEQWDAMFLAQGSCCKICKRTDSGKKVNWHTDHCHKTGKIRGILCHRCNVGLGCFKDDIKQLKLAVQYLTNS